MVLKDKPLFIARENMIRNLSEANDDIYSTIFTEKLYTLAIDYMYKHTRNQTPLVIWLLGKPFYGMEKKKE
jgi:hypothetical protein